MAHGSLVHPGLAWREAGAGVPLLVAEDLEAAGIGAAFSCRLGGRSGPPFDRLNVGLNTGDDTGDVRANRALLAAALGLEAAALATVYQVHGPAVLVVEAGRPPGGSGGDGRPLAAADGIVTGAPGVGAAVGAADCVPVLLADPEARVVGAIHAGWRGIRLGVVETAVAALARAGGDPGATVALLGPAIGGCCYEVGPEVRDAVLARCPSAAAVTREGRPSLDLAAGAAELLHAAGVREVRAAGLCTADDPARFFSARRDRRTGRQAGVIVAR
jgi:polyphenol oxidase